MSARAELVPMGTITAQLGQRIEVGDGPKGTRLLVDVTSVEVESDRLRASLAATDAADWLTVGGDGTVGCVDVRLTLKTDDGAYIYVEYGGRSTIFPLSTRPKHLPKKRWQTSLDVGPASHEMGTCSAATDGRACVAATQAPSGEITGLLAQGMT